MTLKQITLLDPLISFSLSFFLCRYLSVPSFSKNPVCQKEKANIGRRKFKPSFFYLEYTQQYVCSNMLYLVFFFFNQMQKESYGNLFAKNGELVWFPLSSKIQKVKSHMLQCAFYEIYIYIYTQEKSLSQIMRYESMNLLRENERAFKKI